MLMIRTRVDASVSIVFVLSPQNVIFQKGNRLYMPESDVCKHQNLAYKGGPST